MKLVLQVNSRAINDTSRSLEGTGVMITPPLDEKFWLFRVPLSENQAIIGFPKFGCIGIGFQKEKDWNTNLPSGTSAREIYDHIKHNRDCKATPAQCIEAIEMIRDKVLEMRRAETITKLKDCTEDSQRLDILGDFLRHTGSHQLAKAMNR